MKKKLIRSLGLCVLSLIVFFSPQTLMAEPITVNKIIAVVNGEMLTLHQLQARVATELVREGRGAPRDLSEAEKKEYLNDMINDLLMRQEAERLKITVTDQDINPELKSIIKRSRLSQKDFEAKLASQGTSIAELRKMITDNILRKRVFSIMIARKIFISDEDIKKYYDEHPQEFETEKSADFSLLIFPKSENANDYYAQIQKNPSLFESIARKVSIEPHAKEGGRVGYVPWENLPPALQGLFTQLKPGQMTPLVRIEDNFGIIKLNDLDPGGKLLPFSQVKELASEKVREPLIREKLDQYLKQLRSRAVIDVRL